MSAQTGAGNEAQVAQATEYVVLTKAIPQANTASGVQGWTVVKTVSARSATEAIRAAAGDKNAAQYVAVPARSWNPVNVTPKTTTTFDFGDAS